MFRDPMMQNLKNASMDGYKRKTVIVSNLGLYVSWVPAAT
jgi:hypothetical protein